MKIQMLEETIAGFGRDFDRDEAVAVFVAPAVSEVEAAGHPGTAFRLDAVMETPATPFWFH